MTESGITHKELHLKKSLFLLTFFLSYLTLMVGREVEVFKNPN